MRKAQAFPSTSNVMVIGMGEIVEGAATFHKLCGKLSPWHEGTCGCHTTHGNFMVSKDNRILQRGECV